MGKQHKGKKPLSELDVKAGVSSIGKFKLGTDKPVGFYDNLKLSPVFSFQYLNLNASELCFNNPKVLSDDYHKLFSKLKELAEKTYGELKQQNHFYKFHEVDFNDKKVEASLLDFKKALSTNPGNIQDDDVPTCFQFEIFKEKRVFGFLGNSGVFFLVWLDYNHTIYKRE